MGLFDSVRCEYPLPGNPPACAAEVEFQTKDLTCYLMHYTITVGGRLLEDSGEEDHSKITATIYLGWNNVVASGPGIYTRDGEDAQYLEYTVVFHDGRLTRIEEVTNTRHRAMKSPYQGYSALSAEELQQVQQRQSESLIGRVLYLWWGGQPEGCAVTVVAENDKELVVQRDGGHFEVVPRSQRDNCLFDSREDGQRDKDERAARWAKGLKEYEDATKE